MGYMEKENLFQHCPSFNRHFVSVQTHWARKAAHEKFLRCKRSVCDTSPDVHDISIS